MKIQRLLPLLVSGVLLLGVCDVARAQGRVDRNVVYGMYSGTALRLDVHYPAKPNGFGVIFIPGSGWSVPLGYAAPPLKESVPAAPAGGGVRGWGRDGLGTGA